MDPTELVKAFEHFQEDVVLETSDHALSTLTSMVSSGAVDLKPVFQRRDRWDTFKQSQLIESFVLNIPVPPIYLAEAKRGTYDVIDGKQRLTAISQFISGKLTLRSLERFPELNGLRYAKLPPDIRSTLDFRPLRTVTLLRQSSDNAKYEVFHRLNSGGQVLNAQEIRNVLYRGPLNDLVYALSEHPFLRQQLKIQDVRSSAYKNMTDAEWVLRFFAVHARWKKFSGDYKESMDRFMEVHKDADEAKIGHLRALFEHSIKACELVFGYNAFKRPEKGGWRDQALAGLYDAQMIAFAEVPSSARKAAIQHRESVISGLRRLFSEDPDFDQATRQATNTPARVRYRVQRTIELLTSVAG